LRFREKNQENAVSLGNQGWTERLWPRGHPQHVHRRTQAHPHLRRAPQDGRRSGETHTQGLNKSFFTRPPCRKTFGRHRSLSLHAPRGKNSAHSYHTNVVTGSICHLGASHPGKHGGSKPFVPGYTLGIEDLRNPSVLPSSPTGNQTDSLLRVQKKSVARRLGTPG
jgi:hypothetical protein